MLPPGLAAELLGSSAMRPRHRVSVHLLAAAPLLALGLACASTEDVSPTGPPGMPGAVPADAPADASAEPPPVEPPPPVDPVPPGPVDPDRSGHALRDRIVAVVDEEAILLSDLEQVIGLGLAEPREGEPEASFRARVLDGLIDQRVRFQEVDELGFERVAVERIEAQVEQIEGRFPSRRAYLDRLDQLELTEELLRQLVARQLMVLNYVEERLGARVFVGLDDIRAYYDGVLAPEMRARGQTPPPLEEVREDVREVLKEQRLNLEIVRWTDELRREADVRVFLDEPVDPLPPIVDVIR